jgi:hypothetical protein
MFEIGATNIIELSSSRETASYVASQQFPSILLNLKVHHRVHKSPPLSPFLSHINPGHTTPLYFCMIYLILSIYLRLGLPSSLFPCGFPTNTLYAFLFVRICATCPANLNLLFLMIVITSGEE